MVAFVRLVGEAGEDRLELDPAGDGPAAMAQIERGAAWVVQRLSAGEGPRAALRMVVVDVDGGRCEWLTPPGLESTVVSAALAQATQGDGVGARLSAEWGPPTTQEATVEALASTVAAGAPARRSVLARGRGAAGSPGRVAILALPDVSARLFEDALDGRGVGVDRAVSLWHAAALAWDGPRASTIEVTGERVVSQQSPVTAVVLVDPLGRIVWSWSRGGELVAAGTVRVWADGQGAVHATADDIARLTADWLGWSIELGVAPVRVVCVLPEGGGSDDGGLSPAEIGRALAKAWSGATVDLAVHADPIGATLQRLARVDAASLGPAADPRLALVALTHRPGRAHRSLLRWVAGAIGAGAVALGAVAWKSHAAAAEARRGQAGVRAELASMVEPLVPANDLMRRELAKDQPLAFMEELLSRKRQEANPVRDLQPSMPVLAELNALSVVLGNELVRLREIDLTPFSARVDLTVADTTTAELVMESLLRFPDTNCDWSRTVTSGPPGGRVSMSLNGRWRTATPGGGQGGTR